MSISSPTVSRYSSRSIGVGGAELRGDGGDVGLGGVDVDAVGGVDEDDGDVVLGDVGRQRLGGDDHVTERHPIVVHRA